jgi:hypothetical protein
MPRYYDKEFTEILQKEMVTKTEVSIFNSNQKRKKIELRLGEKIIGFESDENKNLKSVLTERLNENNNEIEKKSYPAQLAVLGLGF